jgi:hypothetical protein
MQPAGSRPLAPVLLVPAFLYYLRLCFCPGGRFGVWELAGVLQASSEHLFVSGYDCMPARG